MAAHSNADVQVRLVVPGDDPGAQVDLAERAFGDKSPADRDYWLQIQSYLLSQRRCPGAFVDGRPAGRAMFHDMRQWWCGRAVPMAGVVSVRVAPENRRPRPALSRPDPLCPRCAGRRRPTLRDLMVDGVAAGSPDPPR